MDGDERKPPGAGAPPRRPGWGAPPASKEAAPVETIERGPGGAQIKVATVNGKKVRFIDSYWTFAIALAFAGPFALPLYWRNPRASKQAKVNVTVIVAVLTVALFWVQYKGLKSGYKQYKELKAVLEQSQGMQQQ